MSDQTASVDSTDDSPDEPQDLTASSDSAADAAADGDAVTDLAWDIPMATMWPLMGVLVALMAWRFWLDPVLLSILPLMGVLAAISIVDLRELRVPNAILKPSYAAGVPLLIATTVASEWPELSLTRALIGALVLGGFYFILWFIYPAGMGFGDVKLAPLLGAQLGVFGFQTVINGLFVAHLVGGVVGLVIVVISRRRRAAAGPDGDANANKIAFPFAPAMVFGTVVALVIETL